MAIEIVIQIVISVASAASVIGFVVASIRNINKSIERLEEKQDRHNSVIERMVKVEESVKSSHHRIDGFDHKFESLELNVNEFIAVKRTNRAAGARKNRALQPGS